MPSSTPKPPDDLRRHREATDRNSLIGFFAVLFVVGGGLIWAVYGGGAMAMGVGCMALGAGLTGVVMLIMLGIQWLSRWLDERD